MMTDVATLRTWLGLLGLDAKERSTTSGEALAIATSDNADPSVEVQRRDTETWEVVHERRVPESVMSSDWHAPWDSGPPAVVVEGAAREVAYGFPLVESETRDAGGDVTVRFRAPMFDDGLTPQAFVLTVSSVLKSAEVFELVLARRAQEMADWRAFEADVEQRKQEQDEVISRLAEAPGPAESPPDAAAAAQVATRPVGIDPVAPTPSSTAPATEPTLPGTAWTATHVVTRRADAWAQPDPGSARAGTLKRRVQVQVVEREGEWARVVTSNGWSGWIDGRDLKAR